MDNNQVQSQIKENETKGRGLFYGVIAVATFIIMAVGATFAYFTATTNSAGSAVQTGSTTLQLKFISYNSGWMNNDLIPADTNVVEYSFENQSDTTLNTTNGPSSNLMCKDDFGNSICSVYVFQVYNSANSPQSVSIQVISENNGFQSLRSMAYEISIPSDRTAYDSTENNNGANDPTFRRGDEDNPEQEGLILVQDTNLNTLDFGPALGTQYQPIFINRNGVTKRLLQYLNSSSSMVPSIDLLLPTTTGENAAVDLEDRTVTVASNITIDGGSIKTFALVMYIKNENRDQTLDDASKTFTGQVVIGNGDNSSGVSGVISVENDSSLQSGETLPGTSSTEPEPDPDSGVTP